MGEAQGIFVVGTDTGVGKTLVTCALVRLLRESGVDAVGFKPVMTGATQGRWGDAEALREAGGDREPLEHICPLRFHAPLTPSVAAKREGMQPNLDLARSALAGLTNRYAAVVCEGIGGILVPLTDSTLLLDFLAELRFPLVVTARAALGTINHTLLTLRELERARLEIAAVVLSVTRPEDAAVVDETRTEIERFSKRRISAVLDYCGEETNEVTGAPGQKVVARAVACLSGQINSRKLLRLP
jgi:dethiobiotin synthetase